jgi:DNA-binding NarL/FixJ family response regulator
VASTGTAATVRTDSAPLRVVVVDDSDLFRDLLVDYLVEEPFFAVVGTAEDGAAAEALIDLTEPDVVILDVHLPKISGLEVLEQTRSRHTEALFVVSSSDDTVENEAIRLGADVCIDKTTPFDEICDAIVHAPRFEDSCQPDEVHASPTT